MTTTQRIIEACGERPYGFWWVLVEGSPNPHLNFEKQNRLWLDTLREHDEWFAPFVDDAVLVAISDNGNLLFEIRTGSLLCTPRDGAWRTYDMSPVGFVSNLLEIRPDQLPPDLWGD